jgi:hypothetical protein
MYRTLVIALVLLAGTGQAATFNVNSESDAPDSDPGDGVCQRVGAGPGVCTLRAAIMEANELDGADQINLTAGHTYALTRNGQDDSALNGDLDIQDSVNIIFFASGERPIVDANGHERAFEIHGGNVTMLGFDITGGEATLPGDSAGGGVAINFDAGNVLFSLMRFHGNTSCHGGGLYNDGPQTRVTGSEFFDNIQGGDGCGTSTAAGIRNRGTLMVETSSIYDNDGTGISSGIVTPATDGILTVHNSTISQNTGSGINTNNEQPAQDQVTELRNVTIAGNAGIGLRIGGVSTALVLRSSIVARNNIGGFVGDCQLSAAASASYVLDSYNLDSDGTCNLEDGTSNFPNTDPLLTPLKYRGFVTRVHWPRPDSPIIDSGHPAITGVGCLAQDQHLIDRPQDFNDAADNNCDVGAVELEADVIFFDSSETL